MEILKFTEEHKAYRERLRLFLEKEVIPLIPECEEEHITPRSMWKKMGKEGFLCPCVPVEYGGPGLDFLYSVIVNEEMARICFTGLAAGLHSDIVVPYILSYGSERQKKHYLPECVSGDIIAAVAMTEPDAGSDVASMVTTAVEDGNEIVINGSKTFISNGVNCDIVVLAAKDPAIENKHQAVSLYIVEAGTPGFTKGEPFDKMGWKSQDTAELFFSDCRIPKQNRLGQAGDGFIMLMGKLQQERLVCSLGALFSAETMLDYTMEQCKNTMVDGRALSRSQAVQFALVEMASELRIVRTFMESLVIDHIDGKQIISETSMGKYWTTDMVKRIASRCMDLQGSAGSFETSSLVRPFRDNRVTSIFAGTNEIMKGIIAKMMQL
ncbi:MAG: acyl-CoA dehydrogenase family protein [Desulfobacterium sp.]|jgi:acyl-CoA dehydrogenase|nr:acyl-CoA dehydrogenase family protein [Desulfobacterium sp.]